MPVSLPREEEPWPVVELEFALFVAHQFSVSANWHLGKLLASEHPIFVRGRSKATVTQREEIPHVDVPENRQSKGPASHQIGNNDNHHREHGAGVSTEERNARKHCEQRQT